MRNGILATFLLIAGADFALAQTNPAQPCPCQNQPRLFPGLFARRPAATRMEPPLFANPQPAANAAPVKPASSSSQKVMSAYQPSSLPTAPTVTATANRAAPAFLPPSLPTAPTVIPTATRTNYNHLLEVSGHDRNFSWITGVLTRKPGLANVWFIHYLPPNAVADLHGGVLPIQTRTPLQGFREGDLVTVIGYVITNADVAPNQRMTAFAADQVNKVK